MISYCKFLPIVQFIIAQIRYFSKCAASKILLKIIDCYINCTFNFGIGINFR